MKPNPKPKPTLVDLAAVLAIVEPFVLNQWNGADVLRKLRALKGENNT